MQVKWLLLVEQYTVSKLLVCKYYRIVILYESVQSVQVLKYNEKKIEIVGE